MAFVNVIDAAKVLGCSVFELLRQPPIWLDWALVYLQARNVVRREQAKQRNIPLQDD